jgi:hypothetical protein
MYICVCSYVIMHVQIFYIYEKKDMMFMIFFLSIYAVVCVLVNMS